MTWSHVARWRRSRQDLAWWTMCEGEGQVGGLEAVGTECREAWAKTWRQRTEAMVKSKWGQDRWTKSHVMIWSGSYHLKIKVGACVASTHEEMKWNAQGKGITYRHFSSPVRCVEKCMTGFRIDGRTIKRGKTCLHIGHLVPLERSFVANVLGSSGVVIWGMVLNLSPRACERGIQRILEDCNEGFSGRFHMEIPT